MTRFFWICLGGAFGSGARYLVSGWALKTFGTTFPFGTLAVNVLGSFFLGVIMQLGMSTSLLSPTLRFALAVGVMGGFTTYSTFNFETLQYLQEGAWLTAAWNIIITLLACLLAGWLGLAGTKWWVGN